MGDVAIRVENLGKLYRIGVGPRHDTLRDALAGFGRKNPQSAIQNPKSEEFWALRDVSFEVKRGEVVGVIGRNGAGKSTLLKILSRITEPTDGYAEIHGRVGSLLEVGTGFHPELTGRENIYLNGAILGMKRTEIDRKFDEIVAFSEIEKFLDTPVKRYSSGMYVRLAFAVAAHLEPEILLVDEVLAVGDVAFQKKCLGKMGDVANEGRTVLFVSHNMGAISRLCEKTLWINQGEIVAFEFTDFVIDRYLSSDSPEKGEFHVKSMDIAPGDERIKLFRVSLRNGVGEIVDTIGLHSAFSLEIEYMIFTRIDNLRIGFRLVASDGTVVFTSEDTDPVGLGVAREPGMYISSCIVPGNLLNNGRYYVTVAGDRPMQEVVFAVENIISFVAETVGGPGGSLADGRLGLIRPGLEWSICRLESHNM